jgi:antitoxin component HigA of HigAB toxin-antitoxin module
MDIAPIKTQRDYRNALKEIEGLMTAKRNTPEGDRLDVLVTLVEAWERKHYRFDLPDPVEAIKYHMDQNGLQPARSHCLHRQPQPRARSSQSQALAHAQNDLATA